MERLQTEVLVVGSGGAGLRASIAARERGAKVLLLSRASAGLANSTLISYGVFASAGFGQSIEDHIRKTMEVGHGMNNPNLVKVLSEEAPARIWELRHKGVKFTESRYGVTVEGKFPILGRQVTDALMAWAGNIGVETESWITLTKVMVRDGRVTGGEGITARGKRVLIGAKAVVLCTGGASGIFKFHDNPITNIGDGYAIADDCGADLKDMEFIQFYPLVIAMNRLPKLLALPSLIQKGYLVNDAGEDVLKKYGLSDLRRTAIKERDRLSVTVYREMTQGRKVYLDLRGIKSNDSSLPPSDLELLHVLQLRYRSATKLLPVAPCAHFTMGGIVIDEYCRTSVKGLFAAGEVACGVHGANRMGGNALTETLVFGYRAGKMAAYFAAASKVESKASDRRPSVTINGVHTAPSALKILREIMWEHCGPVRSSAHLAQGRERIEALREQGLRCDSPANLAACAAVLNSINTGRIIIESAIKRKDNVGAHYRTDGFMEHHGSAVERRTI